MLPILLYTQNLLAGGVYNTIFNGGLLFGRRGFADEGAPGINFYDMGLRAPDQNFLGTINWDCRLMEPEFEKFLPLQGFDSVVRQWVELVATNTVDQFD